MQLELIIVMIKNDVMFCETSYRCFDFVQCLIKDVRVLWQVCVCIQ